MNTDKMEKHAEVGFLGKLLTLLTFATTPRSKGDCVGNRTVKGYVGILVILYIHGLSDLVGTDLL